jgi:glycosyltransferase involved in cell wall biosynthesis
MSVELVSLIVGSRHRSLEVRRLLDSLLAQTYRSFEVILVDQNEDDRLGPVVEDYRHILCLRHIRSASRGHAAALNVGLGICAGDIVGFPDDDCWYAPDLLQRLTTMFEAHPEWHGITGCEAPTADAVRQERFDRVPGRVTQKNVLRRHISFAMFFRRASLGGLVFNERLGIGAGTIWGAGEETEFVLQSMARGCCLQYEPTLVVFHPDWGQGPYTIAALAKARRYGMAMGRLLEVHGFPASLTLRYLARPLLGGAYTFLLGRPKKAVYHWAIFLGRATGYVISMVSNPVGATPRTSSARAE